MSSVIEHCIVRFTYSERWLRSRRNPGIGSVDGSIAVSQFSPYCVTEEGF